MGKLCSLVIISMDTDHGELHAVYAGEPSRRNWRKQKWTEGKVHMCDMVTTEPPRSCGTSVNLKNCPTISPRSWRSLKSLCQLLAMGYPLGRSLTLGKALPVAEGNSQGRCIFILSVANIHSMWETDTLVLNGARGQSLTVCASYPYHLP